MNKISQTVCDSVPKFHTRDTLNCVHLAKIAGAIIGRGITTVYTLGHSYVVTLTTGDENVIFSIMQEKWTSLEKPHGKQLLQPTTNIFAQFYGYLVINARWLLSFIPLCSDLYDKASLSKLQEKHIFRYEDMRPMFEHKFQSLALAPQSRNHTHQKAAAERTGANIALIQLATEAGYRPYVVSQSNSDHKMGIAGSRIFYWEKDLSIPYKFDEIEDKDCLIFIDVDFHCNMNEYLDMHKPMLIYTFAPNTTAGQMDEHAFKIIDDKVNYRVKGGAMYSHYIWDYSGDCISKIDNNGALLTYDVTQKEIQNSPGRRIIFLMPRTYTPWPYYLHLKPTNGIMRKQFSYGPINITHDPISDILSLCMQNSQYNVELPGRLITALIHRINSKTTKSPAIGDIEVFLMSEKAMMIQNKEPVPDALNNVKISSALLHEILPHVKEYKPNVVYTSTIPTSYTALGPLTMVDSKPTCQIISTPLASNPAVFPSKHINNEIAAVNGRVTSIVNNITPRREFKLYANEFVNNIVPVPGVGTPWTYERVIEAQDKTAQRARAALVFDSIGPLPQNVLETFNKAEAYNGTSDPRIITTMKPKLTIDMSRFTIPFKVEVLKTMPWYAPGKTPAELLDRLRTFGQNGFIDSDYTRFDGSISKWLQLNIVLKAYMRWTDPNQADAFKHDFDNVFQQSARTTSGLKYQAGWGTRSGSPITTDGNTMINAFIVYASLREMNFSAVQAWENLGLYAGDDGLTPFINQLEASMLHTANELGLTLKIASHDTNTPVPFLGRIIPRPLTSYDTFQDPRRTIPKLHLSANKIVDVKQAAYNKAAGYLVTDRLTPIIGTWAKVVAKHTNLKEIKSLLGEEVWRLSNAWPQEDEQFIKEMYAEHMGQTVDQVNELVAAIEAVEGETPLTMPIVFDNIDQDDKLDALKHELVVATTGNRTIEKELICRKPTKNNSKPLTTAGQSKAPSTSRRQSKNIAEKENTGKPKASNSQGQRSIQPKPSVNCKPTSSHPKERRVIEPKKKNKNATDKRV
nr:MAG: hypothetical protein [Xinjiang sediment noda-like virus 2]